MIAKHVPMQTASKSDFAGLVKYLVGAQAKTERVGTVQMTNFQSGRVETAILEAINIQAQNQRSAADKTYHLIISFPPGETPEEEVLAAIERRICASIGFAEHQRISVIHHDTDSLHMHVAINKIHPIRHTIHEPFNDYYALGQICTKLEKEFGLQQVDHTPARAGGENRATDMEKHADVESLLGWIKRECSGQIRGAQSWTEMHEVMREHGLVMHERANGLVITTQANISVKASSVGREFSKPSLEKRLGVFEPEPRDEPKRHNGRQYEKKPLPSRFNTVELYARYKHAQQETTASRSDELARAAARKNKLIESAKRKGRLKRAAIKLVKASAPAKKLMYAVTSKALRDEISSAISQYRNERQDICAKKKRQAWADWLRSEADAGNNDALQALRSRRGGASGEGNTIRGSGERARSHFDPSHDSVTKNGTVIYRFGTSAVRDDGDKLNVSCGAGNAGLEAALRMAVERYGRHLAVNGSFAFKEKIARVAAEINLPVSFDNAVLERHRQNLLHLHSKKENNNGINDKNDGKPISRGPGERRDRGSGAAAAIRAAAHAAAKSVKSRHGRADGHQPNARVPGQTAASQSRHGVRELSELGMVHVPNRSEMLLPGYVSGGLEHQGAKPTPRMRRHFPGPRVLKSIAQARPNELVAKPKIGRLGMVPPPESKDRLRCLAHLGTVSAGRSSLGMNDVKPDVGPLSPTVPARVGQTVRIRPRTCCKAPPKAVRARQSGLSVQKAPAPSEPGKSASHPGKVTASPNLAAEKYILEREQKRSKGLEIPKHARYTFSMDVSAIYAGLRRIDGQALALLKAGEEILVLPVDEATARRLKRLVLGQQIEASAKGVIKTKGRSR